MQETAISGFQQTHALTWNLVDHTCSIPSVSSFNFVAIIYRDSVTEAPVIYLYVRIPTYTCMDVHVARHGIRYWSSVMFCNLRADVYTRVCVCPGCACYWEIVSVCTHIDVCKFGINF